MKHCLLVLACLSFFGCSKVEVNEDNSCTSSVIVGVCPASNVGYAVDYQGKLVCFSLATPQTLVASTEITGLTIGDWITGLDFRVSNGLLYALGYSGQLYTLDTATAVATAVGAPFSFLNAEIVMDINPQTDTIRAMSLTNENKRFNPANASLVATDTDLSFAAGDTYASHTPRVVATAYSNDVAAAPSTVLYGLEARLNLLVSLSPENGGTVNTVGALGFNATDISGFDIRTAAAVDSAYAITLSGITGMKSDLYSVNLATGRGTRIETLGGCRALGFAVK